MSNSAPQIAIIGGGAAGFFAAIHSARNLPRARVVIYEKTQRLLAKVAISGGGRCNVTHACFEPRELVKHYPRGERELRGPFHSWQPEDTVRFFEECGVAIKTEPDGRMFPETDKSQTIIDALNKAAHEAGVHIERRAPLERIELREAGGFALHFKDASNPTPADAVVLAVGALRPGALHDCLVELGHTITELVPSLFTFNIQDKRLDDLAGQSVEQVIATIPGEKLEAQGPVLITHWGLSGPAILKLSAWGARSLHALDYRFPVQINWLGISEQQCFDQLWQIKQERARQQVASHGALGIPKHLWERLVEAATIPAQQTWTTLSKGEVRKLAQELTASTFSVNGKSTFKDEFVTCGGIQLKEVNFKTMESRIVPGLYFAGETLDIDGITGGFNFQNAWTSGYIAGTAIAAGAE